MKTSSSIYHSNGIVFLAFFILCRGIAFTVRPVRLRPVWFFTAVTYARARVTRRRRARAPTRACTSMCTIMPKIVRTHERVQPSVYLFVFFLTP